MRPGPVTEAHRCFSPGEWDSLASAADIERRRTEVEWSPSASAFHVNWFLCPGQLTFFWPPCVSGSQIIVLVGLAVQMGGDTFSERRFVERRQWVIFGVAIALLTIVVKT